MQSAQTIGFHESSLVGVSREDGNITLELEGVHVGNELHFAVVCLKGVQSLTCDGFGVDDLVPEAEDGEVLTLQHTKNTLHLIVEWNDFKKRQSKTSSYRIACNLVEVEIR
jgi:hypothetical protein